METRATRSRFSNASNAKAASAQSAAKPTSAADATRMSVKAATAGMRADAKVVRILFHSKRGRSQRARGAQMAVPPTHPMKK